MRKTNRGRGCLSEKTIKNEEGVSLLKRAPERRSLVKRAWGEDILIKMCTRVIFIKTCKRNILSLLKRGRGESVYKNVYWGGGVYVNVHGGSVSNKTPIDKIFPRGGVFTITGVVIKTYRGEVVVIKLYQSKESTYEVRLNRPIIRVFFFIGCPTTDIT